MATEIDILQLPTAEVIQAAETTAVAAAADAEAARAAAVAAKTAAEAVPTTTDGIMAAVLDDPDSEFGTSLSATFATLVQLAKDPDSIIAGAVTGDPVTSAAVLWPGDIPGVMTITARHSTGAVNAYNITHVADGVTTTFTQPAITRNSTGAATNVPQIVVS